MHDLVRLYAVERANHNYRRDNREAALRRLIDFYLHTAHAGNQLLTPHSQPINLSQPDPGCAPHPLEDETAALAWFDTEYSCLLAAQNLAVNQGWHVRVWQLAWALHTFHMRRGHLQNHVTTWRTGLKAAQGLDDPTMEIRAHRRLGRAYARAGKHIEALDHLRQALTLAEQVYDVSGQAHTQRALAWAWEHQGDDQQALTHATHALRLFKTLDNSVWEAQALNTLGWYQARLGNYQYARISCEHALTLHRQQHHRDGEAEALDYLGYIAQHTGQYIQAIGYYHHALTLQRNLGNIYQEATTLTRLGEAHAALDQYDDARNAWQQALDLYRAQHRTTDTYRVQQQLAALD